MTEQKARADRIRLTRADLERQLKATSEMLRLISNSPIQSVLDVVAEHAARLCDANNARIWRLEDNVVRLVATYGESSATMDGRDGLPLSRDTVTGRAACDRRTIHVHDIEAEESEYPLGSRVVKGQGWHTTLATPLLREGTPIGTILVRRTEVRPFSDRQIALLENFAGQAAIAIENVRLFEAQRQSEAQLAEARRELRQLIDTIQIPVASYSADKRREFVNAAWKQYTGLSDEAALGTEWSVVTGEKMWADALATGTPWHTEERVRRADGQYRWFAIDRVAARDENGKVTKWYATGYDIDDRKRAEERLHMQHTVAQILAEAATIEDATPRILLAIGECLGWDVGVLWRVDREAKALRCVELWHKASIEVPQFERVSRASTFGPGLGLPGRVWSSLEPEHIPDVVPDKNFPRAPIAELEGLRAAFAFPILLVREALGVIEFFSREIRQPDQELLNVLASIGSQIGQFIERKRAEQALRLSEAFLAQAQRLSRTGNWVLDATTSRYRYWSEESYRIWGFDPLQGLPSRDEMWQRIQPDDRDKVWKEVQEALRQKRDFFAEFRIVLPDGTVKYLEATTYHTFSPHGALTEAVSTHVDVTERTRAEQALRQGEAKIRRLVDANIIGIFIWDFDGRILEANQAFLDIVGFDHGDLVAGRIRWTDLTPPEWRERDAQLIQAHRVAGTLQPFEKEYFRKDGSRVPVLIGVATFEEGGNQGVAFVIDLTERKRAEEALRRGESWLAQAQRLSRTGTWVMNGTTRRFLYWSDESYRIWGFDPLQGLPSREDFWGRIHPEDRERVWGEVQEAMREQRDFFAEFRILLPDGTVKYLEANTHHEFSPLGALLEVLCTSVDVTERKRAEEALRESEAKFRDYAETASDWFWEIGPDYKFTMLTENAFGSNPADRIGTTCWDHALDLETEPEKWRLVWTTLDSRKPFRDFVYCSARRNGSPIYVKASGKPVFDANGEFRGYRGTGTDVTATVRAQEERERLRQLESDLAHLNRLSVMGELTASLAHEITQPIGSARNNARAALNFLDRQPADLDEVREALGCVVGDADRAGDIIDRIRDHIKKAPPRKHRFDLNEAINEVIVLARSAIADNGVSVQTRLTEGLAPVQGDRVQLQQVVLNLILNAAEAMGSVEAGPRELLIGTEQNPTDGVLVAVRDSGPGIDPEHLDRVFQAFYTTKSSGVGMGLSICRSIIDAHGGRLWADANEPQGAVFQFTLPSAKIALGDR